MQITGIIALTLLLSSALLHSAGARELATSAPQFSDGDTVVFIGDSITHGGAYHIDLALFYATRFPERKIRYINAGVSGDTAHGTLKRLESDIRVHTPNVATLMLGMNDVKRDLYSLSTINGVESEVFVQEQNNIRNAYLQNMQTIVNSLTNAGTSVILLTPSIFDQTANLARDKQIGINDELANYGELLRPFMLNKGQSVVDLQTPMLAINQQLQAQNPSATIVSEDRIHPGSFGHFVMTYAILKAQFDTNMVGSININVNTQEHEFDNCTVQRDLIAQQDQVKFTCLNSALPFPVSEQQREALAWLAFDQEFNQYPIAVQGLDDGEYELLINGSVIGTYNNQALSAGVNLAAEKNTPLYQQALQVKEMNAERAQYAKKIRDIKHIEFSILDNYPTLNRADKEAVENTLYSHIAKSEGKPWHTWLKNQVSNYLENAQRYDEYLGNEQKFERLMYEANNPTHYQFSLRKLP